MKTALEHFNKNLPTFQVWIDTNATLQPTNNILEPLISAYQEVNPTINLNGSCRECFIDMLRWYKIESKKVDKPNTKSNGKAI